MPDSVLDAELGEFLSSCPYPRLPHHCYYCYHHRTKQSARLTGSAQ